MARREKVGDCPVCRRGGVSLTDEDVYPSWLRASMAQRHFLAGNLPDKVLARICNDRNHNMGRVFEDKASPIIKRMLWERPHPHLTAEEIWLVARWAVKTDILFAFVRNEPPEVVPDALADLHRMQSDPAYMPPGTLVRVHYVDPRVPRAHSPLAPNTLVRGGVVSFHPIGTIVTVTYIRSDQGDIDRCASLLKGDARSAVLYPLAEAWPPFRGIAPADVEAYRHQLGQRNGPKLGGGWVLAVPRR